MTKNESENRILTVPNIISLFRICLIPVFIMFLLNQKNISAFFVFIIASISDGIDGWIARKFNQTTRLGKILDPIADRGLLIFGAIVLTFCVDGGIGRLPVWIFVLIILRDGLFLIGGGFLLKKYNIRIDVIMIGKVATTFFYIGFAMLVLAWPSSVSGLGIINVSWLPGFSSLPYFWGIWPIYIGIILNIVSSSHYIKNAVQKFKEAKNAERE